MIDSGYSTIPTNEGDAVGNAANVCNDDHCQRYSSSCSWEWFWNYLKGGELTDEQQANLRERMVRLGGVDNVETFHIHAESIRQIAYGLFWMTMIFAGIFTKLMIDPSTIIHSDLKKMFGYNNVSDFHRAMHGQGPILSSR
jgi:hypothetical protein